MALDLIKCVFVVVLGRERSPFTVVLCFARGTNRWCCCAPRVLSLFLHDFLRGCVNCVSLLLVFMSSVSWGTLVFGIAEADHDESLSLFPVNRIWKDKYEPGHGKK